MTTANGQPRILVVEDDAAVRNLIATALDSYGYARVVAVTGREAIARAATDNPDLVLLDLGLPDIDGVEVVRSIRGWSQMPIIVVSARAEDADKIDALDAGADDYVTKPFSVGELLARIRSSLRRLSYSGAANAEPTPTPSVFEDGDLRIDYDAGIVTLAGSEVHLTPIEYKLLCLLARNAGRVLTHTYITEKIWGSSWDNDVASLRVFMATLRRKLEKGPDSPQYIQTHIGVGYRMIQQKQDEDLS